MRKLFIATLAGWSLLAVYPVYAAPMLSVTATDNGTALTFVPNVNAPGDLTGSFTDANFSQITVDLTGVPAVASPDFGTVTLQVSGFTGTGTHVINLIAMQTGLTQPAGFNGELTMTNNNLIGTPGPGPVTQTFSINGTPLNMFTFPASPATAAVETFTDSNLAAITSETQAFAATFTTAGQDLEATQEFTALAVPEPNSLAMLGIALSMLGFIGWRRRQH